MATWSLTWTPTLTAALVAAGIAVAGARATRLGRWYRELRKPSWQPPDWAFGPAWTSIYVCCVLSVALAWPAMPAAQRPLYLAAWSLNLAANVGWSILFFQRRRPDWALTEVALLWLSIVGVMVVSATASRGAALWLAPYLAWVTFASVLNRAIVRLNAPFSRT